MARFVLALSLALALFAALLSPAPRGAFAEINGPCTGTVAGVDVGGLDSSDPGDAIEVEKDDVLDVTLSSTSGAVFSSHKIDLEIAGFGVNVQDDPSDSDPTVQDTVNVDDYSTYGVGFYKVSGSATLADGTTCSGAVLIQIKGSPFATVAGIGAIVVTALGALFLLLGGLATAREFRTVRGKVNEWGTQQLSAIQSGKEPSADELSASLRTIIRSRPPVALWMLAAFPGLLIAGLTLPGGGRLPTMGPRIGPISLPRAGFGVRISGLGTVGGVLATEGVLVLLQQFAVTPLTQSNTLVGLVAGLLLAVGVTTVIKIYGSREVNRAIGETEARLNAAIEELRARLPETPPPPPPPAPGQPEP